MAENVSSAQTRQDAYHARAAFVQPLTPLLVPSKPSTYPAGGLWTTNIGKQLASSCSCFYPSRHPRNGSDTLWEGYGW
ncbi:hypothetical protein PISMIDRAFT_689118 [Pisolithus microcarpus 441]|uniref:Unplaced genomic scaffold scaffold_353, whole genome shotgun sequence n=1 Tax=Pisolithus microcarpus 441 TaxID=765257 RepID=A0A0C9YYD8_9AGAM|nr:hypothetical protein PISMIDRAFT_689118 [Pisolithus microcarpus 441]